MYRETNHVVYFISREIENLYTLIAMIFEKKDKWVFFEHIS